MKRFHFNLEALQRLYAREEDERKRKFGEANRALFLAEQELNRLGEEYDDYQHKESAVREQGETITRMKLYILYLFDLKGRIERQKHTVKEAARLVKSAREKLIESKRKVKTIERIREKRHLEWKKERNRFEMIFLDDVCQQQYVREKASAAAVCDPG